MESVDPLNAHGGPGQYIEIPAPSGRKRGPKGPRGPKRIVDAPAGAGLTTTSAAAGPGPPASVVGAISSTTAGAKRAFTSARFDRFQHRQRCTRSVTRVVLKNDLPPGIVEDDEWSKMTAAFAEAGPRAPIPLTIGDVQLEMKQLGREIQATVQEVMKGKHVFGILDHFSTRDGKSFQIRALQWIDDDFKLQRVDLDCREYRTTKPDQILLDYLKLNEEWGVDLGRRVYAVAPGKIILGQVTTDALLEMDSFGQLLEQYHFTDHSHCLDHSLDPVVDVAFKLGLFAGVGETGHNQQEPAVVGQGLLDKCRELVHSLSSSPQKNQELREAQEFLSQQEDMKYYRDAKPKDAIQDMVRRWWSSYDMIERLVYLRPALTKMDAEESLQQAPVSEGEWKPMLTEEEWALLTNTKLMLGPFKDAQMILETPNTITSSLILYLLTGIQGELDNMIANGLDEDEDWVLLHYGTSESIIDTVEKIKESFLQRWGNLKKPFNLDSNQSDQEEPEGIHPSFILAHALDPRFKDLECIEDEQNKELVWTVILQEMIQAKEQSLEVQKKSLTSSEAEVKLTADGAVEVSAAGPKKTATTGKRQRSAMFSRHVIRRKTNTAAAEKSSDSTAAGLSAEVRRLCEMELLKYRREAQQIPVFLDEEECTQLRDPLEWWKLHADRYETLWILARYYLAIPATSSRYEQCNDAARQALISMTQRDGAVVAACDENLFEESYFLKRNLDLAF